uniref:unspecific monooxygenase n=1 Tax=Zygaena filipendulae TaxID=287375 RepID=D2JLJ7_9NEOP|nr:cytochrome P450 CYP9A37 [Zygaena filipendulae]
MILITICSLVLLATLWLYLRQVYSRFSKYGVKHLPPVPLLGNHAKFTLGLEDLGTLTVKTYNSFSEERFVGSFAFLNPVVFIRDLELLRKITVKDFEHFLNHRPLVDENVDPFMGKILFSLNDQKWKDMRSTLSPAFTNSKIRLMVPFMVEVGDQMVRSLNKKIEKSAGGYIDIDVKDLMTRYTNDVIASCAFGLKVDSHTDEHNQFYKLGRFSTNYTLKQILTFSAYNAFPNLMKTLNAHVFREKTNKFFKDLVLNTMKDREAKKIIRNDMIHLLMEARKGNLKHDDKVTKDWGGFAAVEESDVGKKQVNAVWTDEELIAQAVMFFIAGFETVSTAMVFCLHELAMNPDIQDTLVREIQENHEKSDGEIDYNSIQQMAYMDMVVSETLRLWSPVFTTDRMCIKDYNIGKPNKYATEDFIVRKGEEINVPIWAFHRSPEYFPDPLKFDPERFSEENKHKIKPFSYIPFGIGPRNCLGSRFALCEIKVMLYQLLLAMEVSVADKTCIPAEVAKGTGFHLRMKGGHWVRMKTRN